MRESTLAWGGMSHALLQQCMVFSYIKQKLRETLQRISTNSDMMEIGMSMWYNGVNKTLRG